MVTIILRNQNLLLVESMFEITKPSPCNNKKSQHLKNTDLNTDFKYFYL